MDIAKGPLPDQLHAILGVPEVDCAVDAVGFEARGCGNSAHKEVTAQVHFFSLPFGSPLA